MGLNSPDNHLNVGYVNCIIMDNSLNRVTCVMQCVGPMLCRWEFRTEEYDIGFGVSVVCDNGERKQIIPVKKFNSHLVTEDDSINCTYLGTCRSKSSCSRNLKRF